MTPPLPAAIKYPYALSWRLGLVYPSPTEAEQLIPCNACTSNHSFCKSMRVTACHFQKIPLHGAPLCHLASPFFLPFFHNGFQVLQGSTQMSQLVVSTQQ